MFDAAVPLPRQLLDYLHFPLAHRNVSNGLLEFFKGLHAEDDRRNGVKPDRLCGTVEDTQFTKRPNT